MDELKKRVAVLECQLRKSEATKKGFEMSTGKLLSFVEVKLISCVSLPVNKVKATVNESPRVFLPLSTRWGWAEIFVLDTHLHEMNIRTFYLQLRRNFPWDLMWGSSAQLEKQQRLDAKKSISHILFLFLLFICRTFKSSCLKATDQPRATGSVCVCVCVCVCWEIMSD